MPAIDPTPSGPTAADVLALLDVADRLGVDVWLDGGWAVDALLGHPTRTHGDLDIVVAGSDAAVLQEALGAVVVPGTGDRRWRWTRGERDVLVDPHLIAWDADGNGILSPTWAYPAEGFTGTGTIAGRTVRCLEPATLVALHTGYEHDESDRIDVLALCERFGLELPPQYRIGESFDELLDEGAAIPTAGWGFDWFATSRRGRPRATEERPPWGYARLLADRIGGAEALLDVQTGGGEVVTEALAAAPATPGLVCATESWAPNLAIARGRLGLFGGDVRHAADTDPLPYGDETFDLVSSRHPVTLDWAEVARVLRPGGRYLGQHVGVASAHEVSTAMLGPFEPNQARSPDKAVAAARAAGLRIVDLRSARLRMEFRDVAAFVYFCRKVIWMVPDFTVEAYRDRLAQVDEQIRADGAFVAHSTRYLIEAVKP